MSDNGNGNEKTAEVKAKFDFKKHITNHHYYLIIAFVILLVIIIITGRILNEINLSSATTDAHIESAHRWAKWTVIICSILAAGCIAAFVILLFKGKGKS